MFLNILKRGPVPPQKSYELKPITRIVHTTSMQKSLMTSFKIHSLPTNNSVDNNFQALCATSIYNNWMRCGQSVAISQSEFVNFYFVFQTKNDNLVETVEIPLKHLVESLPFIYQLRALQIWILESSHKEILIFQFIRISTIKRECWLQQLSKNVQPPSNIEHS